MTVNAILKITTALLLVVLLMLSNNELNPDWLGYKIMYEEGGAWLAETGRDPLYLIINNIHKYIFSGTYEGYRKILSIYFIIFSIFLINGSFYKNREIKPDVILMMLAITSLVLVRFTVQIREGIGLTFALLGYSILYGFNNKSINFNKLISAATLLAIASLIHSSFAPSLFIVLFAYVIYVAFDIKYANIFLNLFLVLIGFVFIYDLNYNLLFGNFILEKGGGREILGDASIAEQLLKVSFLCVFGMATRSILKIHKDKFKEKNYLYLLLLKISGPVQFLITILIIYLILNGYSKLVIGDFFRQLSLFINISLFLAVMSGCQSKLLSVFTVIMILENIRGLVVAVSITAFQ